MADARGFVATVKAFNEAVDQTKAVRPPTRSGRVSIHGSPGMEARKVTRLCREAGTGCLPAQRSWRDVLSARKAATQVSFRSLG
jgi:hypothetical protein